MMKQIEIIQCTINDVEILSQLSVECFEDAYAPFDEPEDVQLYMDEAYAVSKLMEELKTPDSFFYFLKKGKEVIGYLKLNINAAQTEQLSAGYLEVERIYLRKAYYRQGLGGFMIKFSVEKARILGKEKIWLGVWEENARGIAFYKKMGFEIFDEHTFMVGNLAEVDLMMEREV